MTGDSPEGAPVAPLFERSQAPEFFANLSSGFFMHDGVVMITFEVAIPNHSEPPGPVNRAVAGRVTLPVRAAQGLAIGLYDFLKQRGLDPSEAIATAGDPSRPQ
jgi:hypothetical protein